MSDQSRGRPANTERSWSGGREASRSDDRRFDQPPPLRTRRDPVSGSSDHIRPPSSQPSWSDPASSRRRGTGRYAAPVDSLPHAELPDGAPDWMGRRRSDDLPGDRIPGTPRPLGGAERRQEDFGATAHDPRPQPRPRPRPVSWPERAPEPRERAIPADEPDDDVIAAPSWSDRRRQASAGSPRSGARTRGRRAPGGAIEDPVCQQLTAVILVSLVALWILTWVRAGSIDAPLLLALDADGLAARFGSAATVWRLPTVATLLGLMSLGVALLTASRELFAGRFVLGMGVWIQVLGWVAAITLLW